MSAKKSSSITKTILFIVLGIVVIFGGLYYYWQKNKYGIVKDKLSDTLMAKTDSLYNIKYDSLNFDAISGQAFLKNIRIIPDTNRVKTLSADKVPYTMLEVNINSITVNGVKTDKALIGEQMIGDSIIIERPEITLYVLKSVKKETKIDAEASDLYKQILGNLNLIQVGYVIIKDATIKGINFNTHQKEYELGKTSIRLSDVKIDSAHNEDKDRILFSKEASFNISDFSAYNNNRVLLNVTDVNFLGKEKILSFSKLLLNRFDKDDDESEGVSLLQIDNMLMKGVHSNEIVKDKNIFIDSISCRHVAFYLPPAVAVKPKPKITNPDIPDSNGFKKAYSLEIGSISFPDIDVNEISKPAASNNFKIGKFAVKIRNIKADELLDMEHYPISHTKEADITCNSISYNSNDGLNNYNLQKIHLNTLTKQINAESFKLTPTLGEEAYAKKAGIQKDRYDITLKDISLGGVDFENLLQKKILANNLTVNSSIIKIYRDISYPLSGESRVGHYPQQMLEKGKSQINVKHAAINNTYLEYKEKNALSGKAGVIKFEKTSISIDNITNTENGLSENNIMSANFKSSVLGQIAINVNFKFYLKATDGKFDVSGNIGGCDATVLNPISVPMALVKIDQGKIQSADFNFTGNDNKSGGDFVMKYSDFKIELLKKNEDKSTKKRGILSMLANTLVRNDNPHNDKLRTYKVDFERDPQKSFFNLVWKTIFSGMQGTFGIPTNNAKEK